MNNNEKDERMEVWVRDEAGAGVGWDEVRDCWRCGL